MAAIDSLLRLIEIQKAEGLVVAAGQAPRLTRAGAAQPLSMPPVGAELVEVFVRDVLAPAQLEELAKNGAVAGRYQPAGGEAVAVQVVRGAQGVTLTVRRLAAAAAAPTPPPVAMPAPAAGPVARATARPTALAHLLAEVGERGASDLLLSAGAPAVLRVAGELVVLPGPPLGDEDLAALLEPALGEAQRRTLDATGSVNLAHDDAAGRFRINVFRQRGGLAAAFRPIRDRAPTLGELGLPDTLRALVGYAHGLVLVTGPTGSGKSTTLVALLEHLNRTTARHIITLEDPIEYQHRHQRSIIHQREIGVHVDSFAGGLRAALREDPDVIMVGEMRDRETIAAALTAAETGHLVLSTLHCGNAPMAIDRIIDVFPEHQQRQVRTQLAGTLRAVLTQYLLPATRPGLRVPALELMVVNSAIAAQIRESKGHQIASHIQTGRDDGMIPLDRSLAALVRAGQISLEAARAVATDQDQLRALIAGR